MSSELPRPPVEKCIHCLLTRDTSQFYELQSRWFPGCIKSLDSGDWVQGHPQPCSHTSCLPISQGIMVTPSGRLPSVRYSPRVSSIEGKSRDPNVCFMRELRVAWREKRPARLVQERPCTLSRSTTVAGMRNADIGTRTQTN